MLLFAAVRRAIRWVRGRETVTIEHDHDHPVGEVHDGEVVVAATDSPSSTSSVAVRHSHGHRHIARMPDDPFMDYGRATSFGIGMIHGVGAETPTQLLIFLTAAGAGGKAAGMLLLCCFLAGLLTSNSVVALAGAFGFVGAARKFWLYATISVVTASFSLVIGSIFLLGKVTFLPAMFGG
jgi:hypothetical protein